MAENDSDIDIDGFEDIEIEDVDNERENKPIESEVERQLLSSTDAFGQADVFVYKKECLKCSHLVDIEDAKAKAYECTKANGNKNCPAQYLKIMVGVDTKKIAQEIFDAQQSMDAKKIARRMKRLAKHPKAIQVQVLERVKQMMR